VCEPSYAAPELGGSWRSRAAGSTAQRAPGRGGRRLRAPPRPAAPRPQVAKSWVCPTTRTKF